ncbi:hypothetical protein Droror1_Dr00027292 [Drosera rotundifolia]
MMAYAQEFTKLLYFVPAFYHSEKKKKNQFHRGLNRRLKSAIAALKFNSYEDMYEPVLNQEPSFDEGMRRHVPLRAAREGSERSSQSSFSGSGNSSPYQTSS